MREAGWSVGLKSAAHSNRCIPLVHYVLSRDYMAYNIMVSYSSVRSGSVEILRFIMLYNY